MFSNCPDMITMPGRFLTVPDIPSDFSTELKKLEKNMSFLERQQGLLDTEKGLVEKEESLARRQEKLKDYEKEVEEAEAMLNRRQSLCDKRAKQVETLNDDLLVMKQEFISSVEALDRRTANEREAELSEEDSRGNSSDHVVNSPEASAKARRHWTIARRHLIDKVSLLEATVQRYRTQLASATASVTAKDLLIARLNNEILDLKETCRCKQQRIQQLESNLSLTTEEKLRSEKNFEMLLEELQNMDLGHVHKLQDSPKTSPVHHARHGGQAHREHHNGVVKPRVLRKQQSTFSFFNHDGGDKQVTPREKVLSGHSFKDNFKKKILNVHTNSAPLKLHTYNNVDNGDVGHSHGNTGDGDVKHAEDRDSHADSKRVVNGLRDRMTTDEGSKACAIM